MTPEQQAAADYFKGLGALGTDPNYDYVAARQAGVRPDDRGHMPDDYKLPTHITFSDQSIFNDGGAGRWRWSFTPGPTNLKHHDIEELRGYFRESEPESVLIMPEREVTDEQSIKAVVDEQANDEGLWFMPRTCAEDYLQRALRRLHEVIEGRTSAECAKALLD